MDRHLETGTPDLVADVSAEILAAVPAGATVAASQAAFVRAVDEHPDTVVLRVDAAEHVRAVAWVLASTASWSSLTARPTWPVLMQRTGLSRATMTRWLAWLRARGLLGIVESGTTPRFSPMALATGAPNRAALYVLCVPAPPTADADLVVDLVVVEATCGPRSPVPVDKSETPTFLAFRFKKNPYAGARENRPSSVADDLVKDERRSDKTGRPRWPRTAVAGSRADRLALVEALQAAAPALRPASALALRSELRPWLERAELGWDVRWLLHALDHTPDGQAHPFTATVRVPTRWLRHRMSCWLDEHGRPLPAPGVQHAAARATQLTETAAAGDQHAAQARRITAEQRFGELVRSVAGQRYPELVAAVLARDLPAAGLRRLLPAAAAEALTREAVRALLDHTGADEDVDDIETAPASRAAVTAAVRRLLEDGASSAATS